MYIKCVLKPVLNRIKKLEDSGKEPLSPAEAKPENQPTVATTGESLSEAEDTEDAQQQEVGDPLTHASSYAQIQSISKKKDLSSITKDFIFDMSLNFLFETLLAISPSDLGMLFLIYDCQHFSESIITKSINLLLRYTKTQKSKI